MKILRYSADYRTLFFAGFYLVLAVWSWFNLPSQWYLAAPVIALNCLMSFICATITHNTIHCPIFYSKPLNKIFQVILTFTYGHPVSAYVPGHNFSHHKFTQTAKDSIRTDKLRFKWNLLNQLLFLFPVALDMTKAENRFTKRMYKERPKWFRQYLLEAVLINGTKLGLLLYDWQMFVLVVFIPHTYAVWGIVGTNYWQHEGCDKNHPYNHTRTFKGWLMNFLTCNNGYHGAHHEKPGLHWSLYPEYHKKHIEPYLHPNLNRNWLAAYCWEVCIWPGKRVDYLGNPVVLPPKVKDEDWVAEIPVSANASQLGAVQ